MSTNNYRCPKMVSAIERATANALWELAFGELVQECRLSWAVGFG